MGANAVGQILTAERTPLRAGEKFVLPESPGTGDALPDEMVPAILVEKCTFVAADPARPTAIEMDHASAVAFDGVLGREHLETARTRQLSSHSISALKQKDSPNFRKVTPETEKRGET
jgi:hypothetical protein